MNCILYGNNNRDYEINVLCYDFYCCAEMNKKLSQINLDVHIFIFFLYCSLSLDISCFMKIVKLLVQGWTPCNLQNVDQTPPVYQIYNKICLIQLNTNTIEINIIVYF